jgi:3',5'-cyclic AMP phosphodiesterase CpdA
VSETLAHISDLHLGRDAAADAAAEGLCEALLAADVEAVLLTGDVTHRGRRAELARFERIFAPLAPRLAIVPGNHDRLGDDAGEALMVGPRVQAERRGGLWVVRVDSTAHHNRSLLASHGALDADDLAALDAALDAAPAATLTVMMLHHHLLPLPEEGLGEHLAALLGWPHADEVAGGEELVEALRGRCDLVLHGHRHRAAEVALPARAGRALRVLNAGATPELGRARLVTHEAGRVIADRWLAFAPRRRLRVAAPATARAAA